MLILLRNHKGLSSILLSPTIIQNCRQKQLKCNVISSHLSKITASSKSFENVEKYRLPKSEIKENTHLIR